MTTPAEPPPQTSQVEGPPRGGSGRRLDRGRWVLLVVAAVLLFAGAVPVVVHLSQSAGAGESTSTDLTPGDARGLEWALDSGERARVRSVLVESQRSSFDEQPGSVLPVGARVHLDEDSLKRGLGRAATVEATVQSSRGRESYLVVLAWEADSWRMVAAVER